MEEAADRPGAHGSRAGLRLQDEGDQADVLADRLVLLLQPGLRDVVHELAEPLAEAAHLLHRGHDGGHRLLRLRGGGAVVSGVGVSQAEVELEIEEKER